MWSHPLSGWVGGGGTWVAMVWYWLSSFEGMTLASAADSPLALVALRGAEVLALARGVSS